MIKNNPKKKSNKKNIGVGKGEFSYSFCHCCWINTHCPLSQVGETYTEYIFSNSSDTRRNRKRRIAIQFRKGKEGSESRQSCLKL
jgi:hypothetical protein